MNETFPTPPQTGDLLATAMPSASTRALLAHRRSAGKMTLSVPGPTGAELSDLLTVAMRVPDHRRLEPWRFIVLEGASRSAFGDQLAAIYRSSYPSASDEDVASKAAALPMRAPVVVAVVSSPDPAHKTPVWEQELSVGAVCFNLLVAASASGWAGVWLTEWISYDADVSAVLALGENERLAGFIYLGSPTANSPERPRPDPASKISHWRGS